MKKKAKQSAAAKAKHHAMKVELFIEAYMRSGGNGAKSYIEAGFKAKNADVAAVLASRLLRNDKVSKALDERREKLLSDSKLTSDEVMQDLARVVRFDPRKLYRPDGSLKLVPELDDDTARVLSAIEVVEKAGGMQITLPGAKAGDAPIVQHVAMYTKKVKWLDKNVAREQAHKHFGHYEKDNKQRGVDEVRALIAAVAENAAKFDVRP